jgi:NADH-quinone oxidoreductase subunit E
MLGAGCRASLQAQRIALAVSNRLRAMAFALTPEAEKIVAELLSHYPTKRAACLPVLHLCQRQHGWISAEVIDYVARRLQLATSEVLGVVTFYTMYHQQPVAPNVVWVCRTLSCELRGARAIQSHLEQRFGCGVNGTSRDKKFTLKTAECLAACGAAPMVQVNDHFYEDLTIEKLDRILDEIAAKTQAPRSAPPASAQPLAVPSPSGRPLTTKPG